MVYFWRVRTHLPERFGQPCEVVSRGALNSCRVRFRDGVEVITSRNYVRRARYHISKWGGDDDGWILVADGLRLFALREYWRLLLASGYGHESILVEAEPWTLGC